MEEPSVNKEVTLVHKGLFYYFFKYVVFFPIKLLFSGIKYLVKKLARFHSMLKEYHEEKNLNKILSIKRMDDEII